MNLDKTDIQLLNLLQADAKLTAKELSKAVRLSPTPVYERIKRLEKEGYIQKYVALLDPIKIEQGLTSFVSISLKDHGLEFFYEFAKQINALHEIKECHHVTGSSDFIVKVNVKDMDQYHEFVLKKLSAIKGIAHIHSSMVISTEKYTTKFLVK